MEFRAYQFLLDPNTDSFEPTWREEHYDADSIKQAVESVRYTHALKTDKVTLGPTGRVVYVGAAEAWAVVGGR